VDILKCHIPKRSNQDDGQKKNYNKEDLTHGIQLNV
jgi:hypothetical protein